jgi:hypothetical protein
MQKPEGYDEARVNGDFVPVELGGHFAVIKQVSETQSSTGKDMIVVLFDFCSPDAQEGYFMDAFKNDVREEKKWPFNGSKYIMVNDYNDPKKTSRNFKSFCTCVEKSNNISIQWGTANWAQQFKGKKIGVVYGEEESEWDGRITMRHVPKWFCDWDKVKDASIPAPKYLNGATPSGSAPKVTGNEDFMTVQGDTEEELPF